MFLHVRGYSNGGYCFMNGDKAVSVVEALQQNGKKFNKRTLDALNRKNLANESDLKAFELQVKTLNKGLTPVYLIKILRDEKGFDFKEDFFGLSSSNVTDLLEVYKIAKYKAPSAKHRNGSQMRYFYSYLKRFYENNYK